jgi:hypothetical protein
MRQKPPKRTRCAGLTTCLRCDDVFESWDRRQNRRCPPRQQEIKAPLSEEPSYSLSTPNRRSRQAEDASRWRLIAVLLRHGLFCPTQV